MHTFPQALFFIWTATVSGLLAIADIRMKALLAPCDNKAYQPVEMRNGLTDCKRKIQVTLVVNNTAGGNKENGYVHLTEVYEPEMERFSRLFNTIVIRLRQEELLLAYPMRYATTVNGKVTETVHASDSCNLTLCENGDMRKKPPKGYCCGCEVGGNCTVHCLNYSPLWYIVSLLGPPVIKQETYIRLFVQTEQPNLPERWKSLPEHPEELVLSADHSEDTNRENTVAASFLSEKADESTFVLKNYRKLRVLIPFPPLGIPVDRLPTVYAKGSDSIMLIPSNITKSSDVMECINSSLASISEHCHPTNKRCYQLEPYDIFLDEEAKQGAGVETSSILLSSYKDNLPDAPIVYNETSGERFLTFKYSHPHLSLILLEINADHIMLLRQGKKGRINVVSARSSYSGSAVRADVTNLGELPTIFTLQVTQCSHGVANSDTDSAPLRPRQSVVLLASVFFGALDIREDVKCTVELHDSEYGMVASRLVTMRPGKQCVCYLSCQCSCGNDSLSCHLINEEDAAKAGLYKSRAARATDDHDVELSPDKVVLLFTVALLAAGFVKAFLGCIGCKSVGECGIHPCIYSKRRLKRYYEREISKYTVQHDCEGYPVHPKTKQRVRAISYAAEFLLNTLFFFIWPALLFKDRVGKKDTRKYTLLSSTTSSWDDSEGARRRASEVIIPTKFQGGRRTRSHT